MVRSVPDFLVTFAPHSGRVPVLCDVKYRSELFTRLKHLKPRLKAARQFALDRGWTYSIFTEVEIRTERLENWKFLLPYRVRRGSDSVCDTVISELSNCESSTPGALVANLANANRNDVLLAIWHLIVAAQLSPIKRR